MEEEAKQVVLTDADKKKLRGMRFGEGEEKDLDALKDDLLKRQQAKAERAKKFGIVTKEDKIEKKRARAERFGTSTKGLPPS
jgi:hypothetical protein